MNLFSWGKFKGASGKELNWKIEFDALTDADWDCIARMIVEQFGSGYDEVLGVPTGGQRLADEIRPLLKKTGGGLLVVDDVFTTGGSMKAFVRYFDEELMTKVVVFDRSQMGESASLGVKSLFQIRQYPPTIPS